MDSDCPNTDLTLYPGDTLSLRYTLRREGSGKLIDSLVGWGLKFLIKRTIYDADEDAVLVRTAPQMTITDNAALIQAPLAETLAALDPAWRDYVYALKVRSPAGVDATRRAGRFIVPWPLISSAAV